MAQTCSAHIDLLKPAMDYHGPSDDTIWSAPAALLWTRYYYCYGQTAKGGKNFLLWSATHQISMGTFAYSCEGTRTKEEEEQKKNKKIKEMRTIWTRRKEEQKNQRNESGKIKRGEKFKKKNKHTIKSHLVYFIWRFYICFLFEFLNFSPFLDFSRDAVEGKIIWWSVSVGWK